MNTYLQGLLLSTFIFASAYITPQTQTASETNTHAPTETTPEKGEVSKASMTEGSKQQNGASPAEVFTAVADQAWKTFPHTEGEMYIGYEYGLLSTLFIEGFPPAGEMLGFLTLRNKKKHNTEQDPSRVPNATEAPQWHLDTGLWNDMNLFRGETTPQKSFASQLNSTFTLSGTSALHQLLARTLADSTFATIPSITIRQEAVRTLTKNDALYAKLNSEEESLKQSDLTMVNFLIEGDRFEKENLIEKILSPLESLTQQHPILRTLYLHKLTLGHLLFMKFSVEKLRRLAANPAKLINTFLYADTKLSESLKRATRAEELFRSDKSAANLFAVGKSYASYFGESLQSPMMDAAASMITAPLLIANSARTLIAQRKAYRKLQIKLATLERFFASAEIYARATAESPELSAALAQHPGAHFDLILNTQSSLTKKLAGIRRLLRSDAVQRTQFEPWITSMIGNSDLALRRLREIKTHLLPLIKAVGVIDAYRSIASLVRKVNGAADVSLTEKSTPLPRIAFATLEMSSTPHYSAKNLWNLMLAQEKAVCSDIELGGSLFARNAVISGVNAGGKSTILRAIIGSALLTNAFGIAPADEITITPFSLIASSFSITDDIANDNSLFITEIKRAKEIQTRIKALLPGQHGLIVFDEFFRGTNAKIAAELSKAFLIKMSKTPTTITILASHLGDTTKLEQQTKGLFKNFHVKALTNPIRYPFKLYEGATDQNIALPLLRDNGFDEEIVSTAEAALSIPAAAYV